jgi:hypothetical protein
MRYPSSLRLPLFLALGTLGACTTPGLDVIARVQQAKLGGSVGANSSGVALQSNDVANDLGLGETSDEFGGRADLSFGAGKWTFAWSPASFSGNGTLSTDITQGGTTIPAGTAVSSDVRMDVGTLIWTFDFVPTDTVELGLGAGVQLLDFNGKITDGADTVSLDQVVPVPVLAARAGVAFGPFDVSALLSGIQVKEGGDEGTLFDADVMGRWRFFGGVAGHLAFSAVLGWHKSDVKLDYTDSSDHVDADLNVSGLYYGLCFGF